MEATERNDEEFNEKARAEVAKLIEKSIEAIEPEFVAAEADDERTKEIKHLARSILQSAKSFYECNFVEENGPYIFLHIFDDPDACECDTYTALISQNCDEIGGLLWGEIELENMGNAEFVRDLATYAVNNWEIILCTYDEDEYEEEEHEEPANYDEYYYFSDDES